eukprot:scaffold202274_cov21-Tisochrysis_lutea.AAC.1
MTQKQCVKDLRDTHGWHISQQTAIQTLLYNCIACAVAILKEWVANLPRFAYRPERGEAGGSSLAE